MTYDNPIFFLVTEVIHKLKKIDGGQPDGSVG